MKEKVNKITINRSNGITECYVLNKDYRELEEKYNNLLASIEALKPEKELKLYDVVNYCNHEWYVIKIENDEVTLMSKDVIGTCTYSDYNSNDFKESNCIKLLSDFLTKLNLYELEEMRTNYDENKSYYSLIRIPTLREIEAMPKSVRACGNAYWTMTASYGVSEDFEYAYVFSVNSYGYLRGNSANGTSSVRPVIKIRRESLNE